MNLIFADACYWVALADPRDQLHNAAKNAAGQIGSAHLVTTDEVLSELLAFFSNRGPSLRKIASDIVDGIRTAPNVEVVSQSRESFDVAFAMYKCRHDKEYSLVDCRSFVLMRQQEISEALTNDHHFEQEGYTILLRAK
jgi:predicted nucleic acid-binding protein